MQVSDDTNTGSERASTDSTVRSRLLVFVPVIDALRKKQNKPKHTSRHWLPGRKANITCLKPKQS